MTNPRKKPSFRRQDSNAYARLKESWRRPRGIHSKVRIKEDSRIIMPSIGYGAPKVSKYLHPSGYREVIVSSVKDLEKINREKEAVKIAHVVGKKKRSEILKKIEELKIKILNP